MTAVPWRVAPMTLADLPKVIELGLTTPELQDLSEPDFFSREILEGWLTSPHDPLYVAYCGDTFAGFLIGSFHPLARIGYIYDLAVKPAFRNAGIGKALLDVTFARFHAQQAADIWCLVTPENAGASRLYQSYGLQKGRCFEIHIWMKKD